MSYEDDYKRQAEEVRAEVDQMRPELREPRVPLLDRCPDWLLYALAVMGYFVGFACVFYVLVRAMGH